MRFRWDEIHEYLTRGSDERQHNADKRTADLVRAHEKGWRMTADAIAVGLKAIAEAIRDHGRR